MQKDSNKFKQQQKKAIYYVLTDKSAAATKTKLFQTDWSQNKCSHLHFPLFKDISLRKVENKTRKLSCSDFIKHDQH